ncbi:MFS transporter [Actinomycetes bacterium KLBMP 9759]
MRFATQWGDGMFQAALGGAVLFNPERQADPVAVAAGLAVLLLPYSLIGPFAGALLDRWDRKRVLMFANLLRSVLVLVVAATVFSGVVGLPLYLSALAVAGVTRFVLAGLSASLPHVVPRQHIVEANVLAVTIGSGMTALGAATAICMRLLVGSGDTGSGVTTAVAVIGSLLAALLAAGFRGGLLGPDRTNEHPKAVVAVARGFIDGARATFSNPTISASFFALGAHRLAFGISTLLSLMLYRYAFTDDGLMRAGLPGIGEAVVVAAAGLLTAALVTPWLVRKWGRPRTVRVALVVAAVTQLLLAALLALPTVLAAAFVLGLAGQVVKLCTDAAVQTDAGDEVLGRVFALYDVVFNAAYVLAVTAAAFLSPKDGYSPALFAAAAAVYLAGLLVHNQQLRRRRAVAAGR